MSSEPKSEGGGNLIEELAELRRLVAVCAKENNIEPDSRYLEMGVSEVGMMLCALWDSVHASPNDAGHVHAPDSLSTWQDTGFRFMDWPVKVNWDKPSGVSFVDRVVK